MGVRPYSAGRLTEGRLSPTFTPTFRRLPAASLTEAAATPMYFATVVICCVIAAVLFAGCGSSPRGNPGDSGSENRPALPITAVGNAEAAEAPATGEGEPVELALDWAGVRELNYTLTNTMVTAGVEKRARFHYVLVVKQPDAEGNAVAEYSRVSGEQFFRGEWRRLTAAPGSTGLGEMRVTFRVGPQGVVEEIASVAAGDELAKWHPRAIRAPMLATYAVGYPPADVTLGTLNSCVLPDTPVLVGSRWTREIPIPHAMESLSPVRYEGTLIGLEDRKQDTHAIIKSQLLFPGVEQPYVAEVRFSVSQGRVISVGWKSLPGAPEGTSRRLELDAS